MIPEYWKHIRDTMRLTRKCYLNSSYPTSWSTRKLRLLRRTRLSCAGLKLKRDCSYPGNVNGVLSQISYTLVQSSLIYQHFNNGNYLILKLAIVLSHNARIPRICPNEEINISLIRFPLRRFALFG